MKSPIGITLATVAFALIAIPLQSFAGTATCVEGTQSSLYMPNDDGFLGAVSRYNAMLTHSSKAGLQSSKGTTWEINPKNTMFMRVTIRNKSCGSAPGNPLKFMDCTYVGCNEPIAGLESLSTGATLTATNCSSSFVYTSTTWTKQGDGSWTVTTRHEEQRTNCDPE